MLDIHQSPLYTQFMQNIGWTVENIDGINIFIKPFPFIGAFIKIQRCSKIPNIQKLKLLMQKYHSHKVSIEPNVIASQVRLGEAISNSKLSTINYQLSTFPYLPTKTIHIDLTIKEQNIFNKFADSKQRGIRKAQKNSIQIIQTNNIDDFIKLKNKSAGFLGFLTTKTVKPLWQAFSPKNAFCLVAEKNVKDYSSREERSDESTCLPVGGEVSINASSRLVPTYVETRSNNNIIAGVLILIWQKTAYYWIASSTKLANKYHAPTLLVWEALKESRKRGATNFDFEGIYDQRYPKLNKEWLGFTKFKQGFGGTEIYLPKPFIIRQ